MRTVPPPGGQAGGQSVAEASGAADGHGEPVGVTHHGNQPAVESAARAVGGNVGVHRVAREQDPGAVALEPFVSETAHRLQRHSGQPGSAGHPQGPGQPDCWADRWKRPEQRLQQMRFDPPPLRHHGAKRRPVRFCEAADRGGGAVEVAGEHRATSIGQDMGQHIRRVGPSQAVGLQIQARDDGRGCGQRVERAEQVRDVTGGGDRAGTGGAADMFGRLAHDDIPPGIGQQVRRN